MPNKFSVIRRKLPVWTKAFGIPALFCVVVWFVFSYFFDTSILNPANVGWISEGDLRQHYLGWLAIRQAETLGAPLGISPLLAYPFGAPISSTDSNPLISLILWPFSDYLPVDFQFIGPWYLLSLSLGLFFAAVLMRNAGFDRLTALLLGAVLAFQPILFWRYGHDTLTAQWLILAALNVCFGTKTIWHATLAHGLLLFLAISIHPYLFMMLSIIAGLDVLARVLREYGIRFGTLERAGLLFFGMISAALFMGSQLGIFALENAYALPVGVFSADPLGFFNPFNASRLLPQLPAGEGQYEGFAYLGLGGFVLAIVVVLFAVRGAATKPDWKRIWPMIGAALVAFAFAISPVVTMLGDQVAVLELSDDSLLRALFSKLRSSGRFVWVTIYVLVFVLLSSLPRNKARLVRSIAVLVLALQIWDLAPLKDRIKADTAFRAAPISVFDEPEWRQRIARADYIYMSRDLGLEFSLAVGATAFPLQTPLTWFYTAQGLGLPKQIAAEEQLTLRVRNGATDANGLYILDATNELALTHQNASGIRMTHRVENFHVIDTAAYNPQAELGSDKHGLTELLGWCSSDCTALMVAHGDASPKLSTQLKLHLADKGGRLETLQRGNGYALVLRNGEIVEEIINQDGDASANALVADRTLSLFSSVTDEGTRSQISVDGIDFARSLRGMNLLLVKDDGRLVTAVFDTGAESDSLYPDAQFDEQMASYPKEKNNGEKLLLEEIETFRGPVSAMPFVNVERVLTRKSSLLDVLSRCRQDCTMAISIKDEGSTSLPRAVKRMAREMGLTLADLEFRDGYSAIVENGIVLVQGRSFDEAVDVSEVVENQQIRVRSAGFEAGNNSSIEIGGKELSLNQRGLNIVVLFEGSSIVSYHFDTHVGV